MQKTALAVMAVIAVIVSIGSGAWPFPDSGTSETAESITIGAQPYESLELIYIAEDQGYFAGNGLNVTLKNYTSSPSAIEGVLKDEVDIGVSAEYTVVGKVFENEDISAIGCINKYQSINILGRKDRGIENVSDLKGKKIGLTRRGIVEFYLGRFLDLHSMSMQDVTLVNLQSPQYVQAITNGSVDALITGAYIDQIQERLGNNVVLWSAQSSQPGYATLACRGSWASSHPEQINRLLKSLAQAEKYAINHPDDAKAILQKTLNYTDAYMAEIWPQHQFSLTLDQSLLLAMNDEGRWMIKNNLTTEKTLPYFRDYIYTKGLEEVKPEAVNIR